MFYIMGGCSCVSLLLLIFVFDSKRYEPNWVSIFKTGQLEKSKISMLKTTRSKSYQHDVGYGNIVREARHTLEKVKRQAIQTRFKSEKMMLNTADERSSAFTNK